MWWGGGRGLGATAKINFQPPPCLSKPGLVRRTVVLGSAWVDSDKVGTVEAYQMFRDRWAGHRVVLGEFADAQRPGQWTGEHIASVRVAECVQNGRFDMVTSKLR